MNKAYEINFDGIVGPNHNYGGLSFGNRASMDHKATLSNPKQAALQGLRKMKFLHDLGIKQAVIPPQQRPHWPTLRKLGFLGTEKQILEKVFQKAPEILIACTSSSSMWAANNATICPSKDAMDGKVHFTPANLFHKFHRALESDQTSRVLKRIFKNPAHFVHHAPLPTGGHFDDEGAANHTRLCQHHSASGIHVFVYGRKAWAKTSTRVFPARQTLEASQSIARLHGIEAKSIFLQQNPDAIDFGAFHNDVVAVGNENTLFCHEKAYANSDSYSKTLLEKFPELNIVEVKDSEVSLEDAVDSYLFNSQLVTLPDQKTVLIAPEESKKNPTVHDYLNQQAVGKFIEQVHFLDLGQSMQNGGGPACLRLRVVLNEQELSQSHQGVYFSESLYDSLTRWVNAHYRDRLSPTDLGDFALVEEWHRALDELTQILQLPNLYDFQS